MRQTVVDRLLRLLEVYAQDRADQKKLRREMVALKCLVQKDQGARCYRLRADPGPDDCDPCAKRRVLWTLFVTTRGHNRRNLRKIEVLAHRLSLPDPVEPEEPKPLLDLMGANDGRP